MQPHQELQRTTLPALDAFDRVFSIGTRMRLHAQAAVARTLHGKPPIRYVEGPASPHEVVSEGPLARVLRYPAKGQARRATPILYVSSLINRYYVLDLLPELSVIGRLQDRGFEVWVLDWKPTGEMGPSLRFSDYIDGAIASAAADAARAAGVEPVHVLGYCMGGTMATMFAALHPARIKSLTLLGTPIDFHASGVLAGWTRRNIFDADLMMDALGNMPPTLMQSGFKLMNPADAFFKMVHLLVDGADEMRVRHVVALEAWLEDNVAFPGGVYREYIRALYQDNALQRGDFLVGGRRVDLRAITAPLLNVIALRDHICKPPASRVLGGLVSSTDQETVEFDTGHIGLTTSRRAHADLWPKVIDWLEKRT
jgi:polyhydroxyalkanoate synthase